MMMHLLRLLSLVLILLAPACAGSTGSTLVDGKDPASSAPASLTETPPSAPPIQPLKSDTAERETCCTQCLDAASKDPAGRDLSMNSCGAYAGYVVNGSTPLSSACSVWFETNVHTVHDCRSATPKR